MAGALLVFALLVSLNAYRTVTLLNVPGERAVDRFGLRDFRDAIYYPVVAFLDGHNPYNPRDYADLYPVDSTFALYLPLTLLVHLPFGLLPLGMAELAYYAVTVLLTVAIAFLTLRLCDLEARPERVVGLAALLLVSRPGQMNLFVGQSSATLVTGCYAALYFARERPWLSGLGLALSTCKPTFGIPLACLMLARRDFRPVVIGGGLATVLSAAVAAVLAYRAGGVIPLLAVLPENYRVFTTQLPVNAVTSVIRVDAAALLARTLGRPLGAIVEVAIALAFIALGALAVRRLTETEDAAAHRLAACLICVTTLVCVYHQIYCLLLLALPLTALATERVLTGAAPVRRALFALLAIPPFNYLASFPALALFGIGGAMLVALLTLNSGALLIAFALLVAIGLRRAPSR